jgi:protein-disulfide isomerase
VVNTGTPPTITLAIEHPARPKQTRTITAERALIGRETGDLVLDDPESSAVHAEIDCTQGAVIVRDLGSSNGTWRGAERLPQFALLVGQSFRCGATTITLLAIEGAPPVTAGRTVMSAQREAGIGAPARSGPTAPWTGAPASAPPVTAASTPTFPGTALDSRDVTVVARSTVGIPMDDDDSDSAGITIRAPKLAPKETLFPASDEFLPAHDESSPTDMTSTLPGTAGALPPESEAGTTLPNATIPTITLVGTTPPQHATLPNATLPAVAPVAAPQRTEPAPQPGDARRPPVANALIKPGGRPATGPTPVIAAPPRGNLKRILAFSALGLTIVALLASATWFAVKWFSARGSVLATTIAHELPEDTLGFVAYASPRTQIQLIGDAVPEAARKDMGERLGFDPLDVTAIAELGIDPDAPIGMAWLEVAKPTMTVSWGVGDEAKLRAALPAKLAKAMGVEKLEVSDRTFEAVPGLWIESPVPAAVLLRDGRALAIIGLPGSDSANVARHAERIAKIERGHSLAERPGFTALRSEPGEPVMIAYVDGVSARGAIPGSAAELLAARVMFGEVDALAITLSKDGPRTHLSLQTVLREGTPGLRYVGETKRSAAALERIPGPALASADIAVAAEPIVQAAIALASVTGQLAELEREFKQASNLDLRTDVLDNLGGELGVALLKLPTTRGGEDFTFVLYASVRDQEKAAKALAAALPAIQHEILDIPATSETIGSTTVHSFAIPRRAQVVLEAAPGTPSVPEPIRWSTFVTAGHVWMTFGDVDVRAIIDDTGKSLRDAARNDAIRDALAGGDSLSMFADVHELLAAVDPLLSERDLEEKRESEPIWSTIDVVTLRGLTEDRVGRVRLTVHGTADDGLASLLRGVLKVQGAQLAATLDRQRRAADCERHIEHLVQIGTTDTSRTITSYEVREGCESKATAEALACAGKASSFAEVATCGGAEVGLLPPEPEPQAVPYIEDIWPNTRSEAGDGGRPRADVNYGVELGTDPQIRGRTDALVTIVEFGDFQCPYCRDVTSTLDEVLSRHGDDVRLVFRHNPLAMHAEARNAAKAALAAARQGKFWAMHDKLFESQFELAGKYRDFAGAIGLDLVRFDADLADPALDRVIDGDLAVAQRFAVTGTPSFFINGRFLSGGQPLGVFESVINEELGRARTFVERRGNTRKRLYEDMISRFATEVAKGSAAALPPDSGERFSFATTGLPQRGATGITRVSLVECGDFECPYCQRATKALERVVADYPALVTVYFAHNPLSFHPGAEPAARAAVAADKQGKFWEMHDKLYTELDAHAEADLLRYAKELTLDVDKFKADMAAPETASTVAEQQKRCTDNGGSSTPTFFLNGRRIEGAHPYETFKALIDAELSRGI